MSFLIKCEDCGESHKFEKGNSKFEGEIELSVTEDCGFQGCVVETIDLYCWKCSNEVNL